MKVGDFWEVKPNIADNLIKLSIIRKIVGTPSHVDFGQIGQSLKIVGQVLGILHNAVTKNPHGNPACLLYC